MGMYGEGHVKRLEKDAGLGYRRDSTFLQKAMLIALQVLFLDGRKQESAEALDLPWQAEQPMRTTPNKIASLIGG